MLICISRLSDYFLFLPYTPRTEVKKRHGDFIPMTELVMISTIIGIIAGAIAILEKNFGIFGSKKVRYGKMFKDEFGKWV